MIAVSATHGCTVHASTMGNSASHDRHKQSLAVRFGESGHVLPPSHTPRRGGTGSRHGGGSSASEPAGSHGATSAGATLFLDSAVAAELAPLYASDGDGCDGDTDVDSLDDSDHDRDVDVGFGAAPVASGAAAPGELASGRERRRAWARGQLQARGESKSTMQRGDSGDGGGRGAAAEPETNGAQLWARARATTAINGLLPSFRKDCESPFRLASKVFASNVEPGTQRAQSMNR